MPQKRNPVALEHARAIGSKALGQAHAIGIAVHNTPFGDIVDTEDDLQPLVWSMFRDATRAVRLVAAAMQTATFDAARLEARAGRGRDDDDGAGRHAGARARAAVHDGARDRGARAEGARAAPARSRRGDAGRGVARAGRPADRLHARSGLQEMLSPRYFVAVRTTPGGPGAGGDGARGRAVAACALATDRSAGSRERAGASAPRAAPGRARSRTVSPTQSARGTPRRPTDAAGPTSRVLVARGGRPSSPCWSRSRHSSASL